nr:MAG: maturation protein [Leviviridae sp.]
MTGRHREQEFNKLTSGTLMYRGVNTQTRTRVTGRKEVCNDIVGYPHLANPFGLVIEEHDEYILSGKSYDSKGDVVYELNDLPMSPSRPPFPDPRNQFGTISGLELNNLGWEILKKTNPNTPHVSVPTVVGESKDLKQLVQGLPRLVQKNGDDLLRRAASANLSWRFGIKPMVNDVLKLFEFQAQVDKRMEYLNRLENKRGINKKVSLGSEKSTTGWSKDKYLYSLSGTIKGQERTVSTMKMWGSVQWKMYDRRWLPKSYGDKLALARRLTYGITTHAALATAWELLPWSWLIDWFVDVGGTIAASDNTIPLFPRKICVMRRTEAIRQWRVTSKPDWITINGVRFERTEIKERHPAAPFLPFAVSIPVVTAGQWSILGSLAALKVRRRRKRRRQTRKKP